MTDLEREARRADDESRELTLDQLRSELATAVSVAKKHISAGAENLRELEDLKSRVAQRDDELGRRIQEASERAADAYAKAQAAIEAAAEIRRHINRPIMDAASTEDHDRKANEIIQLQIHLNKGLQAETFEYRPEESFPISVYRNICRKMMLVGGPKTKREFEAGLTSQERRVYEASMLDSGFFVPQALGMVEDCNTECAYLLDLYAQISVNLHNYTYPRIEDYGSLGDYNCSTACDFPEGLAPNMATASGRVYDFRGTFCFDRAHLSEARVDLLDFMIRAAQRSHRIKRNEALINGDGIDRPKGWLRADCFQRLSFPETNAPARNVRYFLSLVTRKYGPVTAVMHPRMYAYLMAQTSQDGQFLFRPGDLMLDIVDGQNTMGIRLSECMPDPTANGTLGSTANPFANGAILMAAGTWSEAYAAVTHTPLQFQQHIGRSSMACVVYQFLAKEGGFVKCCDAVSLLTAWQP